MSYVVNKTIRGRENRAVGSPAGRENAKVGVKPPEKTYIDKNTQGSSVTATSVTRSGTIATLTKTTHGLKPGDIIKVSGANESQYNGDKHVRTVPTANTLTYDVFGSPSTPATGTVTYRLRPRR